MYVWSKVTFSVLKKLPLFAYYSDEKQDIYFNGLTLTSMLLDYLQVNIMSESCMKIYMQIIILDL